MNTVRKIVREEIALAMQTLAAAAVSSDLGGHDEQDGPTAVQRAAGTYFEVEYGRACKAADQQRARDAANPFKETEPAGPDKATQALVRAEVTDVLKHLRDMFYLSGAADDSRIAERLDSVISDRETHDPSE